MQKKNGEDVSDMRLTMRPIGVVRKGAAPGTLFHRRDEYAGDVISEIEVFPEFEPALLGIEEFDEILVLFWFNMREGGPLQVHPRGDVSRPKRGVFALRSPSRPNPIGATMVELVERDGLVLKVRGLDAWEGTPVLDIKQKWETNRDVSDV